MDWYTDKDGSYQYGDKIKSQKDLSKDQTYVGTTYSVSDKDGNVSTEYRNDGSIFFTNQTQAYNRMWQNANKYNKEELGVVLEKGVLVLPSHHNKSGSSGQGLSDFGYTFKDGKFYDKNNDMQRDFVATIHTHQNPFKNPNVNVGFSSEDVYTFSRLTPNKPYLAMEQNNTISAEKAYWPRRKDGYYYDDARYSYLQGLDGFSLQKVLNGYNLRYLIKQNK